MKFGKSIRLEGQLNGGLRLINFKLLKRIVKKADKIDTEYSDKANLEQCFCRSLHRELTLVNDTYQNYLHSLHFLLKCTQDDFSRLDILANPSKYGSIGFEEFLRKFVNTDDISDDLNHFCVNLSEVSMRCKNLRRYVIWNSVAVAKIIKKWRKHAVGKGLINIKAADILSSQIWYSSPKLPEILSNVDTLQDEVMQRITLLPPSPDRYICPICLDLIVDPVSLRGCCHRFCWNCLAEAACNSQNANKELESCPYCRTTISLDPESFEVDGVLSNFLNRYFAEDTKTRQAESESQRNILMTLYQTKNEKGISSHCNNNIGISNNIYFHLPHLDDYDSNINGKIDMLTDNSNNAISNTDSIDSNYFRYDENGCSIFSFFPSSVFPPKDIIFNEPKIFSETNQLKTNENWNIACSTIVNGQDQDYGHSEIKGLVQIASQMTDKIFGENIFVTDDLDESHNSSHGSKVSGKCSMGDGNYYLNSDNLNSRFQLLSNEVIGSHSPSISTDRDSVIVSGSDYNNCHNECVSAETSKHSTANVKNRNMEYKEYEINNNRNDQILSDDRNNISTVNSNNVNFNIKYLYPSRKEKNKSSDQTWNKRKRKSKAGSFNYAPIIPLLSELPQRKMKGLLPTPLVPPDFFSAAVTLAQESAILSEKFSVLNSLYGHCSNAAPKNKNRKHLNRNHLH